MNFNMTNIFPYHFIRLDDSINFIFFCGFKWTWIFFKLDKIICTNFVSNRNSSITICYFVTFLFAKSRSIFFPNFGPDLYQRINAWSLFPLFCSIIDLILLLVSLWPFIGLKGRQNVSFPKDKSSADMQLLLYEFIRSENNEFIVFMSGTTLTS